MGKKFFLIGIFSFLVLFAIILIIPWGHNVERQNKVCFRNHCFYVELATTPEERANGLMSREKLGDKDGMLFIFEKEGIYPFWMKNALIPLDMIWINKNNKIVFIEENTQPCRDYFCPSINPNKKAKYVLEISGGIAKKIGLAIGDELKVGY